jgi:uncharacterized protein (DUF302 family)
LNEGYDHLITGLEAALKNIGFGFVSTIDMDSAFKEKIGIDYKRYTILGACNPNFALEALGLEEQPGVLLPCNLEVIDQAGGKVEVAIVDPAEMMQ